ncbi:MAG: nascent polypeptide-associated complex protein [Methanomassiliicoccales archaeon]|nr:nascent polypeptide-associated complex protein [Methanomassiliicoccales archaeon]
MNPRQLKQAMKRLGIKAEEIEGVEEVIIRTKTREYVIKEAAVTLMDVQGQKSFQIIGEPEILERKSGAKEEEKKIPDEDVKLVMEQTGCTEEEAIRALNECDGQPAEAILKIMSSR